MRIHLRRPSRRFLKRTAIALLLLTGFSVWIFYAARRKALNIQMLDAARNGRAAEVETLLQQGADPNIRMYAYPFSSFGAEMRSRYNSDILKFWYWRHDFWRRGSLYRYRSRDESEAGPPLICSAAINHDSALLNALLRHGADIDVATEYEPRREVTLLMIAAEWGNGPVLKSLLARHPHINIRDRLGATPLHHAIYLFNLDAARLLFAAGANPDAVDAFGYTPLMNAAGGSTEGDYIGAATLLLRHGTDINRRNKYHKTALTIAREQKNTLLAFFLLQHGARE